MKPAPAAAVAFLLLVPAVTSAAASPTGTGGAMPDAALPEGLDPTRQRTIEVALHVDPAGCRADVSVTVTEWMALYEAGTQSLGEEPVVAFEGEQAFRFRQRASPFPGIAIEYGPHGPYEKHEPCEVNVGGNVGYPEAVRILGAFALPVPSIPEDPGVPLGLGRASQVLAPLDRYSLVSDGSGTAWGRLDGAGKIFVLLRLHWGGTVEPSYLQVCVQSEASCVTSPAVPLNAANVDLPVRLVHAPGEALQAVLEALAGTGVQVAPRAAASTGPAPVRDAGAPSGASVPADSPADSIAHDPPASPGTPTPEETPETPGPSDYSMRGPTADAGPVSAPGDLNHPGDARVYADLHPQAENPADGGSGAEAPRHAPSAAIDVGEVGVVTTDSLGSNEVTVDARVEASPRASTGPLLPAEAPRSEALPEPTPSQALPPGIPFASPPAGPAQRSRAEGAPGPAGAAAPEREIRGAAVAQSPSPDASPSIGALAAALTGLLAAAFAALATLYTRLSRKSLREQETRQRILQAVEERPGATPADLSRAVGVHDTTVRYHLHMLSKEQLVVARSIRRRLHYFPPGEAKGHNLVALEALSAKPARKILEATRVNPGMGMKDACAVAGVARNTAHYHVQNLQAAGVIRVERKGRALRLFPGGA